MTTHGPNEEFVCERRRYSSTRLKISLSYGNSLILGSPAPHHRQHRSPHWPHRAGVPASHPRFIVRPLRDKQVYTATSTKMSKPRSQRRSQPHLQLNASAETPIDRQQHGGNVLRNSFSIDNKKHLFWALLQLFWTERRGNTWMAAAFPRGTTEVVENLLCFAPTIHRWHSKGLFGLQPIRRSDDGKEFTVKFYWLPLRKPATQGVDLLTDPTIPEDLVGIAKDYRAWNTFTGEEIASGREIVLTTRDPENFPLPSWDLLDLQWTLQRLVALSGAPDVFADTFDDDDSSVGRRRRKCPPP
ncbi:hypothetical protein TESG_01767 [Trichophyton tonsurans CBS 112818]|uniref:HNH nuclease domain-containing protein n=1 Tax=Trichophyton tonsurans (strain CBS 112818) TaxID=647933 RepID=F2RSE7_TRIT1|nr:hypothetical protein TESG_01767 [Trichophyton tonsurans CBS 112818]